MRTDTRNGRRTQLRVESLEGKTLLSAGSVMQQVVHHVASAPIVAQAPVEFSGTLTGPYTNTHVPGFSNILAYKTSGTLSGVGSTHLRGTLILRSGGPASRVAGQFTMRNTGGSMILNVFKTTTRGTYSYKVAVARGSDTAFKGSTGTLTITQVPTLNVPFFISGQSTMTFTSG
jgi:hypothetical protein